MELFFTFIVIGASFFLLSLGSLFFNNTIKGSCGGEDKSCTCTAIEKKMCKFSSQISEQKS